MAIGGARPVAYAGQSVGDSAPGTLGGSPVRRADAIPHRLGGEVSGEMDTGSGGEGGPLRHDDPGLSKQHGERASIVEGRGAGDIQFRGVQYGGFLRRGAGRSAKRDDLEDPVSERRELRRKAAAA